MAFNSFTLVIYSVKRLQGWYFVVKNIAKNMVSVTVIFFVLLIWLPACTEPRIWCFFFHIMCSTMLPAQVLYYLGFAVPVSSYWWIGTILLSSGEGKGAAESSLSLSPHINVVCSVCMLSEKLWCQETSLRKQVLIYVKKAPMEKNN